MNFFTPMTKYAKVGEADCGRKSNDEFKKLVRECHRNDIEVILDVVFNHTAEGNEKGLTLSFRGVDNRTFYMTAPTGEFYNYSGCGNTLNCNHPMVADLIVDSLKHFVEEYHVDEFRFDLASILTREASYYKGEEEPAVEEFSLLASTQPNSVNDNLASSIAENGMQEEVLYDQEEVLFDEEEVLYDQDGNPIPKNPLQKIPIGTNLEDPPVLRAISNDPILRNVKLIAEAWDAGGLYQVGTFPHYGVWAEWNGKFRDDVRNFIKGSDGFVGTMASRLCGSRTFTTPRDENRKTRSILSPVTMDSPCAIWFPTTKRTTFSTEKTTTTEKITTFPGTAPAVRKRTDRVRISTSSRCANDKCVIFLRAVSFPRCPNDHHG